MAGFWRSNVWARLKRGGPMLAIMLFMLLLGLLLGFAAPGNMDEEAANQTRLYIGSYIQALPEAGISPAAEALRAFLLNGALILAIGLFGLHLLGIPLAAILVFLKGLSMGYAMSFLVDYQGVSGFVVIFLSMLPQNIVLLPIVLLAASLAAHFSLSLCGGSPALGHALGVYSMRFLVLLGGVALSALIQGYVCPLLLKLFFIII